MGISARWLVGLLVLVIGCSTKTPPGTQTAGTSLDGSAMPSYRRTGNREQAREHLTTAVALYREMDMRFWLGPADAELAEVRA